MPNFNQAQAHKKIKLNLTNRFNGLIYFRLSLVQFDSITLLNKFE